MFLPIFYILLRFGMPKPSAPVTHSKTGVPSKEFFDKFREKLDKGVKTWVKS